MASWVEKKRTTRSARRMLLPALLAVLRRKRSRRGITWASVLLVATVGMYVATGAFAGPSVPAPTFISGPSDPTNQTSAEFTFTDAQSSVTFQCSLDGAAWAVCSSPVSYAGPLKAGGHTFKVKAKNAQNQLSSEASYGWKIDLTPPPAPQITAKPANPSNDAAPSFSFKDSEASATFLCKLDGAASFTACTSPRSYTGLAAGSHTFSVEAKDVAGNVGSPVSYTWAIDLTPPPPPSIDSAPSNPVSSHDAAFSFSDGEPGVSLLCSLDGDSFKACNSPKKYTGINDGLHAFSVEAVDAAGNATAPITYTWRVDTQPPPKPTITDSPPDPAFSTAATFQFTDAEAGMSFLCKIDSGAWLACSSPKTYEGLALGDHSFKVRAVDAAGNQSGDAAYSWKIKSASGMPFTITGSPNGLLHPGGAPRTIPLTLSNPNSVPIYVSALTVTAVLTGLPSACDASAFQLNQSNVSATNAVTVPANGSTTLPAAGVSAPTIQLNDNHLNQDACTNVSFALDYTGSAHS